MDWLLQISGYIFITITILLLLGIGLAGCVIPIIPGHPILLIAILVAELSIPDFHIAWYHWIFLIILCVLGTIGDNVFSIWGAKQFGSTKAGLWGCFAGICAGSFFLPWGLIIGPFAGALIAELIVSKQTLTYALRSGTGAFLGTLAGFIFKIAMGFAILGYAGALLLFFLYSRGS